LQTKHLLTIYSVTSVTINYCAEMHIHHQIISNCIKIYPWHMGSQKNPAG